MKFGRFVCVAVLFSFVFVCFEVTAQDSKSPKAIKILNNFAAIPFEDGKTIVAEVSFPGLNVLSEAEMLKTLRENRASIKVGDEFYGFRVAKAVKVIRERLSEVGYMTAEVAAFGEKMPNNEMKLDFVVKTGELARVSEIRFEGSLNVSSEELIENFKGCIENGWQVFESRRYEYISRKCSLQKMYNKGYFQAKIKGISPQFVAGSYVVTVEVFEGARFRYGEIRVVGTSAFSEKEILEFLGVKRGDIVDGKQLQDFIHDKLKRIYGNKGYLLYNAEFDPKFVEPVAEDLDGTVDILMTIDEGRLFRLANVEFAGLEKEKAEQLRKLISLADGDVYNQTEIEKGLKKINETKEFFPVEFESSSVEIRTVEDIDERESVEGSLLLRRKNENPTRNPNEGDVYLVIKLRKIE